MRIRCAPAFLHALWLACGLAVPGPSHAQAVAGTVDFVAGAATIRNPAGQARAAERGSTVAPGDTVETTLGRLQIRMVDGAYISLQPQTLLRLDEYAMAGAGQGEERGLLGLLRGGLRTVTGAIGRANRSAYRLTTPTATVGIRGTEFAVTADNGTRVNVTNGMIALCNDGGCVDIGAGQSGYTPDRQTRPTLAFAPVQVAPAASVEPRAFAAAEQRSASGASAAVPGTSGGAGSGGSAPIVPLATGPGGSAIANVATGGAFQAGLLGGTNTFNAGGALTQFIDGFTGSNNFTAGAIADFGADGIIAWGRWTSGVRGGSTPQIAVNYVSNLSANNPAVSSITGTYTVFASTAPTRSSGGTVVETGSPNTVTGSMTVNFASVPGSTGTLAYNLVIPMPSQTFTVSGSAGQYANVGFLGTSSTITSSVPSNCAPCTGNIPFGNAIQGFFTGAAAQRAGANYGFTSAGSQVTGAVVLK